MCKNKIQFNLVYNSYKGGKRLLSLANLLGKPRSTIITIPRCELWNAQQELNDRLTSGQGLECEHKGTLQRGCSLLMTKFKNTKSITKGDHSNFLIKNENQRFFIKVEF
jgi:hypothetical protein